jgi:HD superfamily phosphodiesterase
MSVPDRAAAASLLVSIDPPAGLVRHACGVADVAAFLALEAHRHGHAIDRALAESGALLHDIDKGLQRHDPATELGHGRGSAAWLDRAGHPETAAVVRDHPVTRLADGAWWDAWSRTAPLEAKVVAYADRRFEQRLVSMDRRFAGWRRRHPASSLADRERVAAIRARADELERQVCAAAGVEPQRIRRLRWARSAVTAVTRDQAGRDAAG